MPSTLTKKICEIFSISESLPQIFSTGVVSKLLKKFPDVNIASKDLMKEIFDLNRKSIKADIFCPQDFSLEDYFSFAEKTEFGFHILPDKSFGAGPLYFSLIKKS